MLGLTFEKLLVVTIIAAFILGPRRLPIYAGKLSDFVRELRAFVESSRARAEDDFGVPLPTSEWHVDLRQYDPRRIVRDALEHDLTPAQPAADAARPQAGPTADAAAPVPAPDPIAPPAVARTAAPEAAAPVESATRQRWIVAGGTSGHPRRVLITEPEERVPEEIDSSTESVSPAS